jgi:TolB-like protein/DNA-binding winged helix-turn-helix (wHTH) protein/Tfp pilus assembly protein PilF
MAPCFGGSAVASESVPIQQTIKFGEDFEFDPNSYELRRSGRVLKLERIPTEILLCLVEQRGQLVTREQIVEKIWGKDVFLDTDNSINGAIRKIRQVLKDDPERPRFIQTITGRGYRFIAVEPTIESAPQQPISVQPNSTPVMPISKPRNRRWLVLSLGAVVLIAIGTWLLRLLQPRFEPTNGRVMLAVLPFQNLTGDPGQEYFNDGLTEEMLTQLGNLDPQHLGVIARTSVMHYKGSQTPLNQIGRELAVQYVIEGSVRRDASRVRISAQLIQVKDQSHLWAQQYDRELKDQLALQSEIAQDIADEIQLTLGDQRRASLTRGSKTSNTSSYQAYDLYLKGLYFWNKRTEDGFRQAADSFQQAIAEDPNYARAYAGLASTYGLMSTWGLGSPNQLMPKARTAALKALQLDGTLPKAHTALALVAEMYDYDWPKAEKEFRRAIELAPGYATAHQWYAEYLSCLGRFEEALAESDRARQLDPMSLVVASDRGWVQYRARQYDRAIVQGRAVLDMDPNFLHAASLLSASYLEQRRFPQALEVVNRYIRPKSEAWAQACEATVYGKWERRTEAEQALSKFEQLDLNDSLDQRALLGISIATRQNDRAIAILQKAVSEHSHIVIALKVDPGYDSLRSDPRFQDLLRQVHLAD